MILVKIVCQNQGHHLATIDYQLGADLDFVKVPACRCRIDPAVRAGHIYGRPNDLQRAEIASQQLAIPVGDIRAEIARGLAAGKDEVVMRVSVSYPLQL